MHQQAEHCPGDRLASSIKMVSMEVIVMTLAFHRTLTLTLTLTQTLTLTLALTLTLTPTLIPHPNSTNPKR